MGFVRKTGRQRPGCLQEWRREKRTINMMHTILMRFFFFPLGKSDLYITAMDIGENADMYSVLEYHSHTTLLLLGHKYS